MTERFDEDTELMLRFQAGDESCFETLVERHKQRVFGLVYRFLGGHTDAEDVTQDIFLKVYGTKRTYKPLAKFTTWLYRISWNTCLKHAQKRRLVTVSLHDDMELTDSAIARQYEDTRTPSPSEAAIRKEQARIVKKALDSLPESQRMAVILRHYEELSYEEIAKAMDCSSKAVKSLLHRAKTNLKDKLADHV